jgi:putative flippase GtrA
MTEGHKTSAPQGRDRLIPGRMTSIATDPRERTRFVRFLVVGTIGAVVDFGVMNLLVNLFDAQLVLAGTISFICAILSNFIWNRYWTYPDSRSKPILRQLLEFSVVSVIGLGIRVPILAVLEPLTYRLFTSLPFEIPFFTPEFLSDNLTLAIAVIIVLFWNFFVNRYWTYKDVDESP